MGVLELSEGELVVSGPLFWVLHAHDALAQAVDKIEVLVPKMDGIEILIVQAASKPEANSLVAAALRISATMHVGLVRGPFATRELLDKDLASWLSPTGS